jgi:hypothetical protein
MAAKIFRQDVPPDNIDNDSVSDTAMGWEFGLGGNHQTKLFQSYETRWPGLGSFC